LKLIVAGSRTITNSSVVYTALDMLQAYLHTEIGIDVTEVVSGTAKGPDSLGAYWARAKGLPVMEFPADWDEYGKAAGPMRNQVMAKYGHILAAFWDGRSKGTKDMVQKAKKAGLIIFVFSPDGEIITDWKPEQEVLNLD